MNPKTRNILIVTAALIISFGIGAAWQYNHANRARQALAAATADLDAVRSDLALAQTESTLAMAALAAQLGNFERARQLTSRFFSQLQDNAGGAPDSAQSTFRAILDGRDDTITMLSRGLPEAGLDLARMLTQYREAMGRDDAGAGPAATPAAPDTAH